MTEHDNDPDIYDLSGWIQSIVRGERNNENAPKNRLQGLNGLSENISKIPEIDQREYLKVISPLDTESGSTTFWVSIIGKEEERPNISSTYIAYIFKRDFSGLYLYFHQSAVARGEEGSFETSTIPFVKLKNDYDSLRDSGFLMDQKLGLNGTTERLTERTVAYKYYDVQRMPNNDGLMKDLRSVISIMDRYNKRISGSSINLSDESIQDFSKETGFSRETIEFWRRQLFRKKNIIFQGPPGTGKTFIAEKMARHLVRGTSGRIETVYFHPNYTYEDFIQGLRPVLEGKALNYEIEDGIFKRFCQDAEKNDTEPYVMVIDEINRAKLSRVFGELMYLLEYREKEVKLGSGGKRFRIPSNVYIIGTMNTADRSIALVDHALRRRFSFITISPNYDVLAGHLESKGIEPGHLVETLKQINAEINDPKYEIGISFFMKSGKSLKQEMPSIWQGEIEPYLSEFFYDTPKKVEQFKWENIVQGSMSDWK